MKARLVLLTLGLLTASTHAAPPTVAKNPDAGKQGLVYRTGFYAGRMAAGKSIGRKPLAVAKVLGKAAAVSSAVAVSAYGYATGSAALIEAGHPVLGTALLMTPMLATSSVFPPLPFGQLVRPMEQWILGWRAGRHGWRDTTQAPPR